MKNKLIKYLLVLGTCLLTLLCLWGIAELILHAYIQMGSATALLLVICVSLLFLMVLGIISGLIVDKIMENYEDPYDQ